MALLFLSSSKLLSTVHDIKTVAATFTPDTTYAQIGDTIKFMISIGHDVLEITNDSYNTNTIDAFPGGFGFTSGTHYYELQEAKTFYFGCTYHLASSQMKGVIIVTDPAAGVLINDVTENTLIYPNPTSGFITIQIPENLKYGEVQIVSMEGELVYQQRLGNSSVCFIDLSHLNPGIFQVILSDADRLKRMSVIKK